MHSATVGDVLSITRGTHNIRAGFEVIHYRYNVRSNQSSRGQIDFGSFKEFLTGTVLQSILGAGLNYRSLRTTDYNLFVQDDWKTSRRMTLTFGLRYELDLPFYDTLGRISTFDPALYEPRREVINGNPVGPPVGGFVQAGNVIPQYDLPEVPNVSKRVVTSIDPNNFSPRIGFAYAPLDSGRLVVRGGYGIFYSRSSALHHTTGIQLPPNYIIGRKRLADRPSFADPFFPVPSIQDSHSLCRASTLRVSSLTATFAHLIFISTTPVWRMPWEGICYSRSPMSAPAGSICSAMSGSTRRRSPPHNIL